MRKYFLLSAVALLAATSANATTDYAEVTAKATIEVAGTIDCNDIEYGTIVVKQNNAISTISDAQSWGDYVITGDILSHTLHPVNSHLECDVPSGNRYLTIPDTIELRSTTTDSVLTISEITVNDWADNISIMGTTLTIPANVKAGVYTGSFTVTDTY